MPFWPFVAIYMDLTTLQNDTRRPPAQFEWAVYRDGDDTEDSPKEKLALKGLLLFRACIKMVFQPALTFRYQTPEDKADRKLATGTIRAQVLTDDFVTSMMEIVVTQYFILQPSDLRDWEAEPDEWERREEEIADAWEFSIRSCSEKLFLDLLINFKEVSLCSRGDFVVRGCQLVATIVVSYLLAHLLMTDSFSCRSCSRYSGSMPLSTTPTYC